jgi:uncharacterized protein YunC (DUF1805 family)
MHSVDIELTENCAKGCVVELGPVNLVFAYSNSGLIGCGAFDVMVLDKFNYPAAKVRSATGDVIETVDDLLEGIVAQVNESAKHLGVEEGIIAKDALEKM